jgi:HEAT repeat protein
MTMPEAAETRKPSWLAIGWLCLSAVAVSGWFMVGTIAAGEDAGLTATSGPQGLTALGYCGQELLVGGPASVRYVTTKTDGTAESFFDGQDLHKEIRDGRTIRNYERLTVIATVSRETDTLRLSVAFRNTTDQALTDIDFRPMVIRFPRRPKGDRWEWGYTVTSDNEGEPGIVIADWGDAKLVACCDEVERPVAFGFEGSFGSGGPNPFTVGVSRLGPREERSYRFSLRFGGPAADPVVMARDVYEQFAKVYPERLNWPDRRPIGALFLCRDNTKWGANPRGWFSDETLDVTRAAGRKAFHDRLMKYAEGSIAELKDVGAQGMILWDPEGQQMPHAISYLGDPRVIPRAAPEMDAAANEFFAKFRAAGLRVGVCIRPSRVVSDGKGGWDHIQVEDHVAELSDKIAYAKKRWGCTLFYLDTNVRWESGMWQGRSWLLPTADMYKLAGLHPDVLIVPEFGRFGYWGCCMPYGELRSRYVGTSAAIRAVYPAAGRALAIGDGDYLGNWDALVGGVVHGDIHLFRGWFADPTNQFVKQLYREAGFVRAATAGSPTRPLARVLIDADPRIRWQALNRIRVGDRDAAAVISRRLAQEQDWVIQRKMIEVLGNSGSAAAIEALVPLVKDRRRNLGHFAAASLAKLGIAAGAALVQLASDNDPDVVKDALLALADVSEPKATPVLLSLTDSPKPALRSAAIRALGAQRSPASLAKLITLLRESDKGALIAACYALSRQKNKDAVKPLVELIERSVTSLHDNDVRVAAGDALEAITGHEYGPYERAWREAFSAGNL